MNLGVSSYITSAGLRAVTSGGALGPYFALKYFIPFYDYRLDKTICRELSGSTSAKSISSLNLVSATHSTLFGEKIYANGNYTVSPNSYLFWTSNMGSLIQGGTNTNIISQQSVSTDVNLESSKPISTTVSGTTVSATSQGLFTVTNTKTISGSSLSTFNPLTATNWPLSAFYPVVSYSPNANGITSATGTYKLRIPPSNGSFKFNGLAVYATKVDNNGFDDSGNGISFFNFNPTLFAVVLLDQAQYKQPTPGGINDFEISLDLSFDWSTVNPGSSALPVYINTNYWNKLPISTTTSAYGLSYDGDIVIASSAVPGSWTPRAKLTVTEPGKQQLRLANDETRFTDFRTIRFPITPGLTAQNYDDRSVLSIDTSCPEDSLLQIGYKTSAIGIKSLAIGCYASATGYFDGSNYINHYFGDSTPVPVDGSNNVRNLYGGYTVSIGVETLSQGFGSWATGYKTSSIGYLNFAGGDNSIASYNYFNSNDTGADGSPENGLNWAFGKYTSAISRQFNNNSCDYVQYIEDADNESFGSNFSFGVRNIANGGLSLAFGNSVSANGMGSLGFGYKNLSNGCFSFVGGTNSIANDSMSFAFGDNVSAMSNFGVGIGQNILVGATGYNIGFGLGLGQAISSTNIGSIGIGQAIISEGFNSVAIGKGDIGDANETYITINRPLYSGGHSSFSIGYATSASNSFDFAIGKYALANGTNSYSIGTQVTASNQYAFAMGLKTLSKGIGSFSINDSTSAIGDSSFSIGKLSLAVGNCSLAGGYGSYTGGDCALAFGNLAYAGKIGSIALGTNSKSDYSNSIAIGLNALTDADNQIVIGSCNTDMKLRGKNIVIGDGCSSNIIFNGVGQLNDSIAFDLQFISTDPGLLNYTDSNTLLPRVLTIKLSRNGSSTTVKMTESGYNTNTFKFDSIVGPSSIRCYNNTTKKYYIPTNVTTSQNVLDCSSMNTLPNTIVNNSEVSSYNMLVYYDKGNNVIIFYTNGSNNSGMTLDTTNYSYSFDTNSLYSGHFSESGSYTSDYHYFNWVPNLNHINAVAQYDKSYTANVMIINSNPTAGNGVCSYNVFNKIKGETSYVRVNGLGNYYTKDYHVDYNSQNLLVNKGSISQGSVQSNPMFSDAANPETPFFDVQNPGGSNDRPVSSIMSGMFINSNGYSIGSVPLDMRSAV